MRLINADELLKTLSQYDDDDEFKTEYEYGLQQRLETCINAVEDAPTVDAIPAERIEELEQLDYEMYCHIGKSHLNEQQWEWLKGRLKNEID